MANVVEYSWWPKAFGTKSRFSIPFTLGALVLSTLASAGLAAANYEPNPASQVAPHQRLIARNPNFSDTQNHWARPFIDGLAVHRLITAAAGSEFRPNQPITRAQFAVILQQTFPYQNKYRHAVQFADVPPNHWAAAAIAKAYEGGFLSGQGQLFLPNEYVTRTQAFVAIANGLDLTINPKRDRGQLLASIYTDGAEVPKYAVDQVAALSDRRIIVNYPDPATLNPNRSISRAELAALIYQALAYQGQLPKIAFNYAATPAASQDVSNLGVSQVTLLEINLTQRKVTAFQGDKKLKTYPVAVGRAGWETPTGTHRVKQMAERPNWKNPFTGDVIKGGAPDNPLGLYWIGFWTNGKDWSGFHGTPNRQSVGQAVSHGCIRMYNEDIKELFSKVSPGTIVRVVR
ncbi:L,D-transpeptidase family protein [Pseudanabaena sp. PCC 6802]|uniref:L,D-transpeptidase family protein n=1 Tax=Pseudanabaena sp. PCC 6802 TaxID=118173 RepID=UPI00034B5BC6|nr:L,D-transpeptidase family protein [Pseudanabaena sp. PCC 6802]